MTSVTPIKTTPLDDLNQVVELCVCYGDTKNVAAESAQQQLDRIRGLVMRTLAKLAEPHESTIQAVVTMVDGTDFDANDPNCMRWARDTAAVITHHALTWGIGDDIEAHVADSTGEP